MDAVVGLDARGFLLAPAVAEAAAVPFLPVRKRGKLPGEVCSASFALEYGQAEVEVQRAPLVDLLGGKEESAVLRVAAVDDLLATGGTMEAAVNVVKVFYATLYRVSTTAYVFVVLVGVAVVVVAVIALVAILQ